MCTKLPREVFNYVEFEMKNYSGYKKTSRNLFIVHCVDNIITNLDKQNLFTELYLKKRRDLHHICLDLGLSLSTMYRIRREMVEDLAAEMGIS